MPFEIAPQETKVNPWTETHPREAQALRDLAAHLHGVPSESWDYGTVWCGTAGCAIGHAASVASCKPFLRESFFIGSDASGRVLDYSALDIPADASMEFFFGTYGNLRSRAVPASMVASRIEHWLATGEIR